jgi:adenosylhomocysteinase
MDSVEAIMLSIPEIAEKYLEVFPKELERLKQFTNFLKGSDPNDLVNRNNFVAHITASALIVNSKRHSILLLHHRTLDRWLQPGGHIMPGETPFEAALREVAEELGVNAIDLTPLSLADDGDGTPLDIDTHHIPHSTAKNEKVHYHHDFRYLFLYNGNDDFKLDRSQAMDYRWTAIEELSRDKTFELLVEKIQHALSYEFRTKKFYDAIIRTQNSTYPDACAVVVSHVIPDCVYYLRAINQLWPIIALIPKPSSIDQTTYDRIKDVFPITHITRDALDSPGNPLINIIGNCHQKVILFDIGGYFSKIRKYWTAKIRKKILLIIEDTQNGLVKYEASRDLGIRVVSVAQSPLKCNEDFLVGQSVLYSADTLIRQCGTLIQYMKCGVLGYGKIGSSIAHHLLQRGIKPHVYDKNSVRRIEAYNRFCCIPSRDEILETSDVVFCATGSHCLNIEDFRRLKNGCFIFSVTSSDDEMDLKFLEGEYHNKEVKSKIYKYSNERHHFFLANNGNAVNFIHNAIMGTFIHLVRAEMIIATLITDDALKHVNGICEISDNYRNLIADKWLEIFDPEHRHISNIEYIL